MWSNVTIGLFFSSPDLSPDVLTALVPRMPSSRLKMLTADAIFRNVCCRHGLPLGVEPLSLRKVVRPTAGYHFLELCTTLLLRCHSCFLSALGS